MYQFLQVDDGDEGGIFDGCLLDIVYVGYGNLQYLWCDDLVEDVFVGNVECVCCFDMVIRNGGKCVVYDFGGIGVGYGCDCDDGDDEGIVVVGQFFIVEGGGDLFDEFDGGEEEKIDDQEFWYVVYD